MKCTKYQRNNNRAAIDYHSHKNKMSRSTLYLLFEATNFSGCQYDWISSSFHSNKNNCMDTLLYGTRKTIRL